MKNNLGNWIIVQSGKVNTTECDGSIYLEVSILVPSDQYKCTTTGVDTLYFLYKLILISGKCQSYCYLSPLSQRGAGGGTSNQIVFEGTVGDS